MPPTLENPFYYLENFDTVLEWVHTRYPHLLSVEEEHFIRCVAALPRPSRALLVRMVMRKGPYFRASKLIYDEIGCTRQAAGPLVQHGWIDDQPQLSLDHLAGLLTKGELLAAIGPVPGGGAMKKADLVDRLRTRFDSHRRFDEWHPSSDDCVYALLIHPLCDRIRLLFFGNCRQDWSEFVLADLGIWKYEKVALSSISHGLRSRDEVDHYLHLFALGERFENGEDPNIILGELPPPTADNDWLASRRAKLVFKLAQHYERADSLQDALSLYTSCTYPGARIRAIRVMERCGLNDDAYALASAADLSPESEAEKQQIARIRPRLQRRLGMPMVAKLPAASSVARVDLPLPAPTESFCVEQLVAAHLATADAPLCYVENTLINSLFGLLCWNAVFAPVPGAFFHPFQSGPADLYNGDFFRRREKEFNACLSQLDSQEYVDTVLRNFVEKADTLSPFVAWQHISEELLRLALQCIPSAHLKAIFHRMLADIRTNRAGFPDLIQFWPDERRYRMIEVKAPNDRLQDNQVRWLDYFMMHDIPVSVCFVQWLEEAA
ncbi:VRR-NUC domain-containing protein [Noviherbaspirillum sp. Root189]|uniref:VRR-NUC domain-containing protein n=1 Tax=Noviherbaspirillum sp. Root189 TaxID=1736487 RepID=UPI00070B5B54|nr:VRR-NUC domain-containing protein [Noviherbaspirillum sp. Root189]KRB78289.1 nuclease [Noviherbaspirillum sp. Root189]